MPIEDGMRNATKNLDEAAGAAPTSKVVHANDPKRQDAEDRKQNEAESPQDESDDD